MAESRVAAELSQQFAVAGGRVLSRKTENERKGKIGNWWRDGRLASVNVSRGGAKSEKVRSRQRGETGPATAGAQ